MKSCPFSRYAVVVLLLVTAGAALVTLLMVVVVPKIRPHLDMDAVPWVTVAVFTISDFIQGHGLLLLGALGVLLLVVWVTKHWISVFRTAWGALTVCALVTAIAAWWRLYQ